MSSRHRAINIDVLGNNLYTAHAPPLDILVRTSGVRRLSDFLLWQTTLNSSKYTKKDDDFKERDTLLGPSAHFVQRYWPEFGILDVLPIILGWQAEQLMKRATKICTGVVF